ncbi:hypothetical protein ASF72_11875 [Arthrobacter sp. Leaf141]|uniref:glycerophosphodiester phosphodiesterase family protein n=1 Tax=unclassified Arthrobacter TaxID=235627 RepID=UPI0006F847CC|nr:glycerophosphodiester phosphodiesterase family protein [Arthrobacter sp. Leaf141]KQR02303.1 hypothetical protein ASF72_11875 [Arthrobacter sp. Leaf141]
MRTGPDRRTFLGLAAAGAAWSLTGCQACPDPVDRTVPGDLAGTGKPGTTATSAGVPLQPVADVPLAPAGPATITDLLATPSFYIAHRGSGDNWTEHTLRAYRESAALGIKAIEVSVSATSDGVLICHHDPDLARMTGRDFLISATSLATVATLRNDARAWLGPATGREPVPELQEVLDLLLADTVIFLEDKQGTNQEEILALLAGYPDARDHIVWKQPAQSKAHAEARRNGYTTWGYFGSGTLDGAAAYFDAVDLLGVPALAPTENIRQFVATGKPVIGWEVHRRSERDRLLGLGVRGMMCANAPYVLQREPVAAADAFTTGQRAPGDLPWDADSHWQEQPTFTGSALRMASATTAAYTLGSMGPIQAAEWLLEFELRWPAGVPGQAYGAGIMFALADDSPWRPGQVSGQGGYLLDARPDGRLILYRVDRGSAAGTVLGEAGGAPARAGQWQQFQVAVTAAGISAGRGGTQGLTSTDAAFRGGYFALAKNYDGGPPVEFRNVRTGPAPQPGTAGQACPA